MPITDHQFDRKKNIIYTVSTPEYEISEKIPVRQLLVSNPEQLEVYEYMTYDRATLPLKKRIINKGSMKQKLQQMFGNYMSAGLYDAALDIVQSIIESKRKPSNPVIMAIIDLILRPKALHRRWDSKELLKLCYKAHRTLLNVLDAFGAEAFKDTWVFFRASADYAIGRGRKPLQEYAEFHDDDEPHECSLSEFLDIWDMVARSFENEPNPSAPSMQAQGGQKRRRLVLDVLLTVMETDLRERRENIADLRKSVFLAHVRKDGYGTRSQFDRYLNILFPLLGHDRDDTKEKQTVDVDSIDVAGRFLNMFIILAYCDNLMTLSELVDQAFRQFKRLDAQGCANLVRVIRCSTFISAIFDLAIADSDCSQVPEQYQGLRKSKGASLRIAWIFYFAMKTRPLQLQSLEDVYRHTLIVHWRLLNFFNERNMRCDICADGKVFSKNTISTIKEPQMLMMIEKGPTAIADWEMNVEDMIQKVLENNPSEPDQIASKKKIRWLIKLAFINICTL